MFSENAKTFVQGAIDAETNAAISKWGEKYSSLHEGYAVLKEEVDEARDEHILIRNNLYDFWGSVKKGNANRKNIEEVRAHAEQLALEAVQVAAVCNKILKGL